MKKILKSLTLIFAVAMVLTVLPMTALAEGSYYVDSSVIDLKPGEVGYITITANDATGRVDWSSTGPISASGTAWLDNGQTTFEVSADAVGTGSIVITPVDFATYDGEELTYPYTVQVNVIGESAAPAPAEEPQQETPTADNQQETTKAEEETTTAEEKPVSTEVLTDGNNDYADLTEEERLYTSVDGQELYIIRYPLILDDNGEIVWNGEVRGLDRLTGFELDTVNYKEVQVDSFLSQDGLRVFVLKNLETDVCNYYTLGENGFSPLNYVTANGKQYIVVGFANDYQVPAGYQMVDLTLGNNSIRALKKVDVEMRGYEVLVSPGLESVDPTADIYYIYCLVDGEKQIYSYDSGEGTLQRAAIVVYNEIPVEPETVVVYEEVSTVTNTADANSIFAKLGLIEATLQMKVLVIAVAVAIVLIIIFIICLIVSGAKNSKLKKKLARSRSKRPSNPAPRKKPVSEDDDSFFSYVKTEKEDDVLDIEDLK